MINKPIPVTKPSLPPLAELTLYLEAIWENKILTNNGPFHAQLEHALCDYLEVKEIALFNNGTIALMAAIKLLELSGEVITTPYTFVATSHALLWNNLTPVFVDIDPHFLNIDPKKIEAAITEKTSAILAVHCYGHPCDVEAIQLIADKYNLKVIYDAAHAFGVEDTQGSILNHGDLSVLSFHATKVFNTIEGGAIVCHDAEMKNKINRIKNFGIANELEITETGLNGKLNEVSAAFGLVQLKHMEQSLKRRQHLDQIYRQRLEQIAGIRLIDNSRIPKYNYSYFPVLIEDNFALSRDELYEKLKEQGVYARRYFYPLLSSLPMYRELACLRADSLTFATDAAKKILCLPLYPDLELQQQEAIIQMLEEWSK